MKHVKELVLEGRRNFKSYKKYISIINNKFKIFEHFSSLEENKTNIFEEHGEINVSLKIWSGTSKVFITFATNMFGDVNYRIFPANGNQIIIEFYNISKNVFDEIDLKIDSNK